MVKKMVKKKDEGLKTERYYRLQVDISVKVKNFDQIKQKLEKEAERELDDDEVISAITEDLLPDNLEVEVTSRDHNFTVENAEIDGTRVRDMT